MLISFEIMIAYFPQWLPFPNGPNGCPMVASVEMNNTLVGMNTLKV